MALGLALGMANGLTWGFAQRASLEICPGFGQGSDYGVGQWVGQGVFQVVCPGI